MLIINRNVNSKKKAKTLQVIAIWGVGLIGSSIYEYLSGKVAFTQNKLPFSWTEPHLHDDHLQAIKNELIKLFENVVIEHKVSSTNLFLDILWSAGKCGFSATEDDTINEFACFEKVLKCIINIKVPVSNLTVTVHLISSAGGIFEGLRQNQLELKPAPLRPYGELKLKQEKFVLSLSSYIHKKIYRPSSVYGFINLKQRMGLIPTLIYNGLSHRVSTIFGELSTLRDYIFCQDIGRFVGDKILNPGQELEKIYLIASSKPSSIGEIQKAIEDTIGRKIYINFVKFRNNRRDICFLKNQIPKDLNPLYIRTGIQRVYYNWIQERGLSF